MSHALLLGIFTLASPASAMCTGELAELASYAGGSASAFLENPTVSSRVSSLGIDLTRLKSSLAVSGVVDLINCELVVEGNAAHRGGEQNAILSLSLYSGIMTVGMLDEGRVRLWSTPHGSREQGNYSHLPVHIRDWAYVAAGRFGSRSAPPPGVSMAPARSR
jgi:hypothetical protein